MTVSREDGDNSELGNNSELGGHRGGSGAERGRGRPAGGRVRFLRAPQLRSERRDLRSVVRILVAQPLQLLLRACLAVPRS